MVGISAIGCQKADTANNHPSINIDVDANIPNGDKINESQEVVGNSVASNVKAEDMVDYVPQYADLLKDEVNWPIGKWGYHEPPETIRNYMIEGIKETDYYRVPIHSEKYGDLEMEYSKVDGKRYLFEKGKGASGRLMVVDSDITKTNAELLRDLNMGDAIADNFFK